MRSNTSAKSVSQSAAFLFLLLSLFVPNVSFAQDNDLSERGLLRKQQAIDKLGNRLSAVAAKHGKSPSELRRMFLKDSTLHIDKNDRLLYVEAEPDAAEIAALEAASSPQAAPYSYSNTFALHSRPGSTRKIYLDFNGHTIGATNAWFSYFSNGVAAPFNLDGDPNSFSEAEQDVIQNVWLRISEDYAPFDVDVTTQDPGNDFFGTRAVMTPTNFMGAGIGGVAFMGVFGGPEDFQPAWIFTGGFGNSHKGIAEAASHEIGHNLGLDHDGAPTTGYYSGHGVWAPIMGVGYSKSVSQWSKGEYPGANNQEDDLAVIQRYGAPLIADEYGNTTATANVLSGSNINVSGLITTRDDVDVFRFTTGSGNVSININSAPRGANLDIKAQILDSAGNVIAISDPSCFSLATTFPAGMSASFNQFLSAGTYYLTIDGAGSASDDSSAGYSDYASIGQYNIIGTLGAGGGSQQQAPVAAVSANPLSGTAPLNVNFFSTNSYDPDGWIVSYAWNFGDGTSSTAQNPSKIYYSAGTFTASLTVTDNSGLTGTRSVLITVTNPATVSSIGGTVFYGNTPVGQSTKYVSGVLISGNGTSLASTNTNANGSYLLDNLNAGGTYTVTPSKTGNVNGITAFDATLVLQHVAAGGVGANALNVNQRLAADTNNSGTITSFDASQILRFAAANGANANSGEVGNWRFSPSPRTYYGVSGSVTNQYYEAILVGEINGNWSPTGSGIISGDEKELQEKTEPQKQESEELFAADNAVFVGEQSAKMEFSVRPEAAQQQPETQVQISLPANATGQNGSTVLIPITLTNTNTSIAAYAIEVTFDPNVLQPHINPVSTTGTLSDSNTGAGCQILSNTSNTSNRATLRLVSACTGSLINSGTLLNMRFNVIGTANTPTGMTTLEFTVRTGADPVPDFENNSGTIPVAVTNGLFTVVSATPIASVTVGGRVLTADGRRVRNALVRLNAADGSSKTVMSGPFGYYRFANVQAGQSVTIQVVSKQFAFQPKTVNVSGDVADLNFIAQP